MISRVRRPETQEEHHVTFSKEGLARLKAGLTKAGLDPRFFAWPPENEPGRAPYRGLSPMEANDAGIFFGRDGPIIQSLDALRGLAEAAPPRLFVLLGASGAGKSSFLRAGLLPRLDRDYGHFLPLPVIRPEHAMLKSVSLSAHSRCCRCRMAHIRLFALISSLAAKRKSGGGRQAGAAARRGLERE